MLEIPKSYSLDELTDLSYERLKNACALANKYMNVNYSLPDIHFNLKGKTAGLAYPFDWKIRINQQMLLSEQLPFINEVIPHELAHLFVYRFYNVRKKGMIKPHGKEWADLMVNCFKLLPKVTHNYEIPKRQVIQFIYSCSCRTHHLSKIRHNKVQDLKSIYSCRQCHNPLIFSGKSIMINK